MVFETMANKVAKIKHTKGFTPYATQNTKTKPLKKFICEYPYRYYTELSISEDKDECMILWPVEYYIPSNIASTVSVIARVKRLRNSWAGVYIFDTFYVNSGVDNTKNYSNSIQLVSNTQLYFSNSATLIKIPSIETWPYDK